MYNLHLIQDIFNSGYSTSSLYITSFFSIIFGIAVLISKNPIVSILFLIGLFLTISMYLMLLGVNFIGLSYLLVYVGAVSILFIFILMLINIRISEIVNTSSNSIPLAVFVGSQFLPTVYKALPTINYTEIDISYQTKINNIGYSNINNFFKQSNVYDIFVETINFPVSLFKDIYTNLSVTTYLNWEELIGDISHINSLGNILYTNCFIWLLLTSIILLLAMIGCILISIKEN